MAVANKLDYVKAIGRLYDFSSRIKFHLIKKELIDDEIGKLARKINDDIVTKSGINLFAAKEEKDLLEYERYLNNYNLTFTKDNYDFIEVGDDLEFIKNINRIPIERFKAFKLQDTVALFRIMKERYGINVSTLKIYLANPSYIDLFEVSYENRYKCKVIYTTTNIKLNNKERILLNIFTNAADNKFAESNQSTARFPFSDQSFSLSHTFVLSMDKYSYLFSKPSELFLKIIDLYGITIGDRGKKLLTNEYFYKDEFDSEKDFISLMTKNEKSDQKSHEIYGEVAAFQGRLSTFVGIGYSINMTKYMNDYRQGLI